MVEIPSNGWKLLYESGRQALQDRKLPDAEQSFSAALQLAEDFPAGDPRLAATLNALARIYSLQRRYLAAAALLNRLLEVTERTLGPTHVQVAGVLTNLAEMYTHLGAAREELELRERVLRIRGEDPNADITSLQRLWDRVAELRAILISQESSPDIEDEIDQEPLPIVRTAEYSAPIPTAREPESETVEEPIVAREAAASHAETHSTVAADAVYSYDGEPRAAAVVSSKVEIIRVAQQPASSNTSIDHGFSDMGRDELEPTRKVGGRLGLYSIIAGVLLIAGLIAARDYVKESDDERVSGGTVSLTTATPPRTVVTPVLQASAPAPEPVPEPVPEPPTVERLIADRRAGREARRADEESATAGDNFGPYRPSVQRSRVPTKADLERALRNVDGAVKMIAAKAKAATDSALAIQVQVPTFKKIRLADNPQSER